MSEMQGEFEEACGLETEGNPDWSQETRWPGASSLSLQRQRAHLQNGEGKGGPPQSSLPVCQAVDLWLGGQAASFQLQGQREPSKSPPGKGWVRKVIVRDTGAGPEKPREQEVGGSSLALDSLCAHTVLFCLLMYLHFPLPHNLILHVALAMALSRSLPQQVPGILFTFGSSGSQDRTSGCSHSSF